MFSFSYECFWGSFYQLSVNITLKMNRNDGLEVLFIESKTIVHLPETIKSISSSTSTVFFGNPK